MTLAAPYKIQEDTTSDVVRLTRLQFNALLDAFSALIAASQQADFASFKSAAALLDATLKKVEVTYERPLPPTGPNF